MRMIGSCHFQNDVQEFIRKPLSSLLYLVPYSFRHPSIESVTKRFWNQNKPLNEMNHAPIKAYRKVSMDVIKILDKQVDTYLTVSLKRCMSGFIKRLV
ncbi:hypothetical protein Gogos_003383, partial [Gossypium gossypioides]|nr:hypothetical protein [Gossypium gossypioides]